MPGLPVVVDILGKPYDVHSTPARDDGDYGLCLAHQCRIEVAEDQCETQKRDTLLHEVLHGVDNEMHCGLREPQIRRMATGLLAVLRHNPALVAFLTA
jgi:hypothetical protein